MKEYLFRGKIIDGQGWAYGLLSNVEPDFCVIKVKRGFFNGNQNEDLEIEVYPKTVGQMIARVKGVGVFEGDFCKFDLRHVDESMPAIKGLKGVAVLNNGIATISNYYLQYCINIEIIDNIHDNPKLL